ncbi:MAG: methyltransferase domain-containing protein [Planctomycetota bacterium]
MSRSSNRTLVNLGCGPCAEVTNWQDYDGSWNLLASKLPGFLRVPINRLVRRKHAWPSHVKYVNLLKKLPFQDESVEAVYASHVWEHLYYCEAEHATAEVFRILSPGGTLRLAVPNLHDYVCDYMQSHGSQEAASRLNERLHFRANSRPRRAHQRVYEALTDFHSHKFMYDVESLKRLLTQSGFEQVEQKNCMESEIPEISEIETESRVGPMRGFAVEGRKPVKNPA